MSKGKFKARVLKDVVVNFVSLVDNPASKIPFRVIKRDQPPEGEFMINLDGFTKTKKAATSALLAVVCRKQDRAPMEALLKKHELSVDDIVEQEECLIYRQEEFDPQGDVTAFQIAPNTVAMVSNVQKSFSTYIDSTIFSENLQSTSFFPSFNMAMDALMETTYSIMYSADDQGDAQEMITKATTDFSSYVNSLVTDLPEVVFRMAEPLQKNMMTVIKAANAAPYLTPKAPAKKKVAAKKRVVAKAVPKGDAKKTTTKKTAAPVKKTRATSVAKNFQKKRIQRVVSNDPRPAEDPAIGIKDNHLSEAQQAAGQAAAEAVDNWEERDAAYNRAAALIPNEPKEYDENGQEIEYEDERDEDSGYDPAVHDAHTGHTDEDDPNAGTTEGSEQAEAARADTDPERFDAKGPTGDVGGNIGESFTDPEPNAVAQTGEAPESEEVDEGAESEEGTEESANAGGDGSPAGETEETVEKSSQLAAFEEILKGALTPLVSEVQNLNARVDGVEEVAKGAKTSSDKLGNTVLAGDTADELQIHGHSLKKTSSTWDNTALDSMLN